MATKTPAPKATKTGNPHTEAWNSAEGRDLGKGDSVKAAAGGALLGTVAYRFTKPLKDGGRVPMVGVLMDPSAPAAAAIGGRQATHVAYRADELVHADAVATTSRKAWAGKTVPASFEEPSAAA